MIMRTFFRYVPSAPFDGIGCLMVTQCAIPVFDGLLPEPHNVRVLNLLFDLVHWHGLAKLRMHTDTTLDVFTDVTTSLGNSLRDFRDNTCSSFETRELERERAAWQRREEKKGPNGQPGSSDGPVRNVTWRPKHLNLNTYKVHALGDYPSTIRLFGTTDSYTTQWVISFFPHFRILGLTAMNLE
jgi:hypothetical protein